MRGIFLSARVSWEREEIQGVVLCESVFFRGVVDCVVQAFGFLSLLGLAHDEVAYVDYVSQLAYLAGCLGAFEEAFGFLIEYVEAVPCAVEAEV